jgi:ubiquinone biosynthesis protein COQ9
MIPPPERLPERDTAIEAMLPHVPFDGWSRRALLQGLQDAGMPLDEADLLFPGGPADMVAVFCDLADRRMAGRVVAETRTSARVRALIAGRLEDAGPHREAVRRALAVLALPGNARTAAACAGRTIDTIWYLAGDRSADFSWYTKRALLTGVYGATLLFWLRDTSEDYRDTLAFLDRRLAGIGQIGTMRRRAETLLNRFRSPFTPRGTSRETPA